MGEDNVIHTNAEEMLQGIVSNYDLFKILIECLPYPVQVYAPDGTLIMVNKSFLEEFNIPDPNLIIGKSNILHDHPIDEYDIIQNITTGFAGKVTYVNELRIPVHVIKKFYNIPAKDVEIFYMDISALPLKDDSGEILCVVNIFIIRRKLTDSIVIAKAKSYIEAHWKNEFHGDEVAKDVYISPSHFLRLFKAHTGMTPHDYYISVKIKKLKEKLLDINLSIEEAFAECGVQYHGHYAELFKKKTGLTPSEYRKLIQK